MFYDVNEKGIYICILLAYIRVSLTAGHMYGKGWPVCLLRMSRCDQSAHSGLISRVCRSVVAQLASSSASSLAIEGNGDGRDGDGVYGVAASAEA